MTTFISTKQLYGNFKHISDEVQKGHTFIVLKHSKPAYKITPLDLEDKNMPDQSSIKTKKKYTMKDLDKFIFKGRDPKVTNLATTYKDFLYS